MILWDNTANAVLPHHIYARAPQRNGAPFDVQIEKAFCITEHNSAYLSTTRFTSSITSTYILTPINAARPGASSRMSGSFVGDVDRSLIGEGHRGFLTAH